MSCSAKIPTLCTRRSETTDVITENVGEGVDIVNASASYTLSANIENLTLTGTAISATGNASNNILTGNASNNILDGGAGADTMIGGAGNDTYFVDNVGDIVTEVNVAGSKDIVHSTVTYTLSNFIYQLSLDLSDPANIASAVNNTNATGNGLNNKLVGNAGNNQLDGKAGADDMAGGAGDDNYIIDNLLDVVTENVGEGFDTIYTSVNLFGSAAKPLTANVEALTLVALTATTGATIGYGNGLDNLLTGNLFNNTLDGGAGVDTMVGGAGNDTYFVDNTADVVTELVNEGTDIVNSTAANYSLTANIENLTILTTAALNANATGNASNNILTGNADNNILTGGDGADTLIGGLGQDTYNLAETTPATDIVRIAVGDSLVSSANPNSNHDIVNNFGLGTGVSTTGVDKLDLAGITIAANVAAVNGVNVGTIASHHISSGIISFDNIDTYTTALTPIEVAADLASVFAYLQTNITGGGTVAFVSGTDTYVFQDGGAGADTIVELVGVSATSVSTTGAAAGSIWIM